MEINISNICAAIVCKKTATRKSEVRYQAFKIIICIVTWFLPQWGAVEGNLFIFIWHDCNSVGWDCDQVVTDFTHLLCQKSFEYKVFLLAPVLYIENVLVLDCIKSV